MTIVRQMASFFIGILFIFLGLIKVAPVELDHGLSQEEFKAIFTAYFVVLPIKSAFGVMLTPDICMSVIGFMEIVCGSMLAFGRSAWRRIGTFYLLIIVVGANITQQQVGTSISTTASTFILGMVLAMLLINKGQTSTENAERM